MKYEQVGNGEIRLNVENNKPYVWATANGQEEAYESEYAVIHTDSWPVGAKFTVSVPVCPDCGLNAEHQDSKGKCHCGFDWNIWAANNYGE